MAVSAHDREYFRRLGALQAEGSAERLARHRALSVEDRLRRSLALSAAAMGVARRDRRDDDPTPFYERARRLGLYAP